MYFNNWKKMDEFPKTFIDQFHNLPGDTVKQKQQNLFKLFRDNYFHLLENPNDLNTIVTNLKPSSFLEKIFRIDFLIYFKRFKELYQEFLTGDEITLSKVVKHQWFFQEAFKSVGAEEFVRDILPTMSYALKLKILRRLPCNEAQSDEIFEAVFNRYGLSLAKTILPNCSVKKIEKVLKSQLVKLTPSQLKLLYNKDPNLIYVYFEERTKHEGNSNFINNNPILVHIAQKNPEMFAKLFEKYKFQTHLGNRTTKRYIKSQKNTVVKKSESYLKILKKGPMVRKLGGDLKCLFFKTILDDNKLYWKMILKYYPKSQKFNLFKSVYNSTYYYKFGEDVDAINQEMLQIMTDPEEREKIAKQKLEKEGDEDYLQYITSEYALDDLKRKLDQMTAPERLKFVQNATNCYIYNKDLDALLQLCEIVAVRLKNDGKDIRHYFMFALVIKDESLLDKLGEEHWKFIMEILAKSKAEQDWIYKEYFIRCKYLEYIINNDKSLREEVAKCPDLLDNIEYEYIWEKPTMCRKILKELVKRGCKKSTNEEEAAEYDCRLAAVCKKFNRRYPQDMVNIFSNQRILKSVKMILEKNERIDPALPGIGYIICQKTSSESVKELQSMFFKNFKTYGFPSACTWFLKNDPTTFLEYLDNVIEGFPESESGNRWRFWRLIKKHDYLKIDQKIVDNFTQRLKEESFSYKKRLIKALTILSPPETHLNLVKTYAPTSDKADLTDEDVRYLYELQCELVKFLHYTGTPETIVSVALEFCRGDYLKYALCPLYSSVYKLPEIQVKSVLEKISENKAISVKKHGLLLGCEVLDKNTVYEYLKNASVPSLTPAVKYLSRNPSDSIWSLIETKLLNSERGDLQALKALEKVILPLEYESKYVEITWTLASKYENKEIQKIVIEQMHKNVIKMLQPQFVRKVIEETVFKIKETDNFIAKLLIHSSDEETVDSFSQVLENFKERQWKSKETRSARMKLHSFVENLFKTYAKSEETNDAFVSKFIKIFNSHFEPVEALEEFITISFMKFKGKTAEECGKFLIQINNDIVKTYSRSAIHYLAKVVKELLPLLFKNELERMQVLHFTFKHQQSIDDCLLIVMLLPENAPKYTEQFKLYQEITAGLENIGDVSVNLQLNLYLKSSNNST